jgi:hypothetical protein
LEKSKFLNLSWILPLIFLTVNYGIPLFPYFSSNPPPTPLDIEKEADETFGRYQGLWMFSLWKLSLSIIGTVTTIFLVKLILFVLKKEKSLHRKLSLMEK